MFTALLSAGSRSGGNSMSMTVPMIWTTRPSAAGAITMIVTSA
jgi:hypothetical protein